MYSRKCSSSRGQSPAGHETVGIGEDFIHRDGSGLRGCDRDKRRAEGQEGATHRVVSAFFSASHAARCVACHGVRSQLVPIAPAGLCSIPVV